MTSLVDSGTRTINLVLKLDMRTVETQPRRGSCQQAELRLTCVFSSSIKPFKAPVGAELRTDTGSAGGGLVSLRVDAVQSSDGLLVPIVEPPELAHSPSCPAPLGDFSLSFLC